MQYLIMCKSLTSAQRSSLLLERKGINSVVIKAPQGLSTSGCAYAISLYSRFEEASRILKNYNLLSGKRFLRMESGEFVEVRNDIS